MDTSELKDRIRNYIEHADEHMLKVINGIIEAEEEGISQSHREILEERIKQHEQNPNNGKSWAETRNALRNKYGL